MKTEIKKAEEKDIPSILELLDTFNLLKDGVENHINHFFISKNDNIIGCVGLEIYKECGLLRSLAVNTNYQKKGIGKALVEQIQTYAKNHNIKEIYVLTLTAESFFLSRGFNKISRDNVNTQVKHSVEFKADCCKKATCMRRGLC